MALLSTHRLSRATTAVVAALAGALLGEVALRLAGVEVWQNPLDGTYDRHALMQFDHQLGFSNRRGLSFRSWKGPGPEQWDQLNSHGMRQPEASRSKPPGVMRIAVIGDSISFGVGVASYREVYPHLVERLCNASGQLPRVEVLNFGAVSNTSWQARASLPAVLAFDPDVLLLMLGNNDSRALLGAFALPEALVPEAIAFDDSVGAWLPFSRSSVVLNLLRRSAVLIRASALRRRSGMGSGTRVSLAEFRSNIRTIADSCRLRRVPLYLADEKLAVNPACAYEKSPGDMSKVKNYPAFREALETMASEPGVAFVDISSKLEAERRPAPSGYDPRTNRVQAELAHLFVAQDPIHLNPAGHRIVARTIFERLVADGVCAAPTRAPGP